MSGSDVSSSVERVRNAAAELGLTIEVIEYPDGTRTAADAAAAVGCGVAQIVKSMIFDADGEIVLALTSGANQVDPEALATLAGASACRRADPERVRHATGYAIGGVAPIGHPAPVRTWIDPVLLDHDRVWAAAGTPRHVFAVDPALLVTVTDARPAEFTA
ncbi:MAG: YbaK/EbsC family protein [Acidimicrobiales bacterium]